MKGVELLLGRCLGLRVEPCAGLAWLRGESAHSASTPPTLGGRSDACMGPHGLGNGLRRAQRLNALAKVLLKSELQDLHLDKPKTSRWKASSFATRVKRKRLEASDQTCHRACRPASIAACICKPSPTPFSFPMLRKLRRAHTLLRAPMPRCHRLGVGKVVR